GNLLTATGRFREGVEAERKAITIQEQLVALPSTLPSVHYELVLSNGNLAINLVAAGLGGWAANSTAAGPNPPPTVSTSILVAFLIQDLWLAEAEKLFRRALTLSQALVAKYPEDMLYQSALGMAANNTGQLLRDTGRPGEARELLDQAAAHLEKAL